MSISDTDPSVQRWYVEQLRALTPSERMAQVFAMIDMGFALEEAGLRDREPGLTDEAVRARLLEMRYGVRLARTSDA